MDATAVGFARTAIAVMLILTAARVGAVPLDDLDAERTWVLGSLQIDGNKELSRSDVTGAMTTHPRAWWAVWRDDPEFDPLALRADVRWHDGSRFTSGDAKYSLDRTFDATVKGQLVAEGRQWRFDVELQAPRPGGVADAVGLELFDDLRDLLDRT